MNKEIKEFNKILGKFINEKEELKLDNDFKAQEIRKYIIIIEKLNKELKRVYELGNKISKGEIK